MIALLVAAILFANQLGTCIAEPTIPLAWFAPEVQAVCGPLRPAEPTGWQIIPPL